VSAEHGQDPAVGGPDDESLGWRQRFRYWRATRPFWAGVITAFAGLWLIWSPQVAIGGLAMTIGIVTDGWLIGALLIILAIGMWLQPQVRGLAGAMVIVLSLGSFIKINFGGFLIGMLAGLVGGAMAIAWTPDQPADDVAAEPDETLDEPDETDDLASVPGFAPMAATLAPGATRPAADDVPTLPPVHQVRRPAPGEIDPERPSGDAGRTAISLLAAVALVPALTALWALGASTVASGQEGSPTPSASPSEPPSPPATPTPTAPTSPPAPTSGSPTATPSTSPTAEPTPTPTAAPPKRFRAAAGAGLPAGMIGLLTADSSTLSGLQFAGIVTHETAHGTIRALRFTADSNRLNDMTLRVTASGVTTTIKDGDDDTTVLSGNVVMDLTRLSARLGPLPVEFTPDQPPPPLPPALVLTDLSADLLLVQCDSMRVPNMSQELP